MNPEAAISGGPVPFQNQKNHQHLLVTQRKRGETHPLG